MFGQTRLRVADLPLSPHQKHGRFALLAIEFREIGIDAVVSVLPVRLFRMKEDVGELGYSHVRRTGMHRI